MSIAYFRGRNKLLRAKLRMASMSSPRASTPLILGPGSIANVGTTNESIREQVALLIELGVSQTALAKRMGVHISWFNRWINGKGTDRTITVDALDGYAAYLADLSAAIHQAGVTAAEAHAQIMRAADATKTTPPPSDPLRRTGKP